MPVGSGILGSPLDVSYDLWPLEEIDPKKAKFPCCIVWAPLPVVSWLVPYIGHVGICREDGAILDFSGSNLVTVDNFAYGAVARYLQLDREQVLIIFRCGLPLSLRTSISVSLILLLQSRSLYCRAFFALVFLFNKCS